MDEYAERLAQRGLRIVGFDGYTLTLRYDPRNDSVFKEGHAAVAAADLNNYAIEAMNGLADGEVFNGVRQVHIDL